MSGATGYKVYRSNNTNAPSGTGNHLVGETTGLSLDDQSDNLNTATVPAINTTDPRPLSAVRVTAAPSPSVTLAPAQVQGNAIVSNPSSTQTITAPSGSGIPLQIRGRSNNSSNVFEVYDNQTQPALQSWFDLNGAFQTSQAPTFSTVTAGSLLFAGAGGLLSQDNTTLFWDNTAKRIKLGLDMTTLPAGSTTAQYGYDSFAMHTAAIQNQGTRTQGFTISAYSDTGTTGVSGNNIITESRHASGTKVSVSGQIVDVFHSGAGTVSNLTGIATYLENADEDGAPQNGTVTNAVNIEVATPTLNGTTTNLYGLRVADMTGVTNNWAIQTERARFSLETRCTPRRSVRSATRTSSRSGRGSEDSGGD